MKAASEERKKLVSVMMHLKHKKIVWEIFIDQLLKSRKKNNLMFFNPMERINEAMQIMMSYVYVTPGWSRQEVVLFF